MKKTIIYIASQILATTLCYTVIMWLLQVIFDKSTSFTFGLLIQGLIFAILYVPLSLWLSKRRKK